MNLLVSKLQFKFEFESESDRKVCNKEIRLHLRANPCSSAGLRLLAISRVPAPSATLGRTIPYPRTRSDLRPTFSGYDRKKRSEETSEFEVIDGIEKKASSWVMKARTSVSRSARWRDFLDNLPKKSLRANHDRCAFLLYHKIL
jgi:hypothetical protein